MDITLKVNQCVFKDCVDLRNLIITRMWIGYGFDAAQITAAVLNKGFWKLPSDLEFLYYLYPTFMVVVAFLLTICIRCYKRDITENKYQSVMAYFKLTAFMNAGVLFFLLYLQEDREPLIIILLVIAGIDMILNFLEMALNCGAARFQQKVTPEHELDTYTHKRGALRKY